MNSKGGYPDYYSMAVGPITLVVVSTEHCGTAGCMVSDARLKSSLSLVKAYEMQARPAKSKTAARSIAFGAKTAAAHCRPPLPFPLPTEAVAHYRQTLSVGFKCARRLAAVFTVAGAADGMA